METKARNTLESGLDKQKAAQGTALIEYISRSLKKSN